MKIEVGKKYRARNGEVVEITEYDPDYMYPYFGSMYGAEGYSCDQFGKWSSVPEHRCDLIEEITE